MEDNRYLLGSEKYALCESIFKNAAIHLQNIIKIDQIISAGLNAVDPINVIQQSIRIHKNRLSIHRKTIELTEKQRIILVGFGKAAQGMALGVKMVLGKYLKKGIIITKTNNPILEKKLFPEITTLVGNHPLPGRNSIESSKMLIEFLNNSCKDDLIICVISGGGSALFTQPVNGISLRDIRSLSEKLILSGADINEINEVRKQIDLIKGGGLARMVYPARMISLIISDVVGDSLSTIASGPTIIENAHNIDAWDVIQKYHLINKINPCTLSLIKNKTNKCPDNSDIKNDKTCINKTNIIIANNAMALTEAMNEARRSGFIGEVISSQIHGDCRQIGRMFGEKIIYLKKQMRSSSKPICLIAGGETTTIIKGKGKGGRNLETALACALEIEGIENACFIALASDGEDGMTDSAGAIVTGQTMITARNLGLNHAHFQERNDTYQFFARTGGLLKTGSTGTNVNDIYILIIF